MVFIWSSGGGRRRRRGHGPGYGPPPGYGYRRGYGGGGSSCLRDLLLLNVGCCAAESLGCGTDAFLLAPTTLRAVRTTAGAETSLADRMIAAVRYYQREISPRRAPCCRFTPTCSTYAVQAPCRSRAWTAEVEQVGVKRQHGARRGLISRW